MQKKNKFLSIFLCLALIMSIIPMGCISASAYVTPSFGGGDGSIEIPYLIEDLEDLEALATFVNDGYDCAGLYFKQTADIEVTNFVPIGSFEAISLYFDGTYDGDNNEINGTIGDKGYDRQALFGFIGENGTIKNVINNADITGNGIVGGVVGHNKGTIKNCYNTGNLTATNNDVGGVVGDNFGTIEYCNNTGKVIGCNAIGGIVGYNGGGIITNCYNTGAVEGRGLVGGVAGCNCNYDDDLNEVKYIGTITSCFNTGAVTGEDCIGGIAGINDNGAIQTNCYYNKDVFISEDTAGKTTLEMSTQDFVDLLNGEGGTAFSFKDDVDYLYYPYLTSFGEKSAQMAGAKEQEYFTGNGTEANPYEISTEADLIALATAVNGGKDFDGKFFKQTADITVTDFVPIGLFYDDRIANDLYFNGTYDGANHEINGTIGDETKDYQALFGAVGENGTIMNLSNDAEVKGHESVGGIAAQNEGLITNCFNTGNITGTGEYSVGGIAGRNYIGTITNCFNAGKITGNEYVCGISGTNGSATILNCFNTGEIISNDNSDGIAFQTFNSDITNCYYDKEACAVEDGIYTPRGKTTAEMSTQDFVDLLNGEDGIAFSFKPDDVDNIYYPYLTSFGEDSAVISIEKVKYILTVTNGTGDGKYPEDKVIAIKADTAPSGKKFKNWTSNNGGTFANANSASTTFTMPNGATTITANYETTIKPPQIKGKYTAYETKRYATASSNVTFTSYPGANDEIVTVPKGGRAILIGRYDTNDNLIPDYYRAYYNGKIGYVSSSILNFDYEKSEVLVHYVMPKNIYLKKYLGVVDNNLEVIKKGEKIIYLGTYSMQGGDWHRVYHDGKYGYILAHTFDIEYTKYTTNRYANTTSTVQLTNYVGGGANNITVPAGKSVMLIGCVESDGGRYYRAYYNGKIGYVKADKVKLRYTSLSKPTDATVGETVTIHSILGDESSVLAKVPADGTVKKMGVYSMQGGNWYRVYYKGEYGYIPMTTLQNATQKVYVG